MSTTALLSFTRLPSQWIEDGGLQHFQWQRGTGANYVAALMVLTIIVNHIDPETGTARLTYDDFCSKASLSRAKVSDGLDILAKEGIVRRDADGRSTYTLENYGPNRWAAFPAKGLYRQGTVEAFTHFNLRKPAELDALKLWFLFATRRDTASNMAILSYDKIEEYAGIHRGNIRRGLSLLAANTLVHIYHALSRKHDNSMYSAYRLPQLQSYSQRRGVVIQDANSIEEITF